MSIEKSACGWCSKRGRVWAALRRRGAMRVVLGGLALAALGCSSDEKKNAGTDSSAPIFQLGKDQGLVDGSGQGGQGFAGSVCAGETAGAEVAPSVMQLLVDTSGSMSQAAPGGGGSKWDVTQKALLAAIDGMPSETSLGVVFYPNVPANTQPCFASQEAVAVAPLAGSGSKQRQSIRTAFSRQNPRGGTPTHDAYRYTLTQMEATAAAGSRFVVLITDGTPTYSLGCKGTGQISDPVDPSPLIDEAAKALAAGVHTFVIGSPGSEDARESLSKMAEAGGTATPGCSDNGPNYCHFDMTQKSDLSAGLASALGQITGTALSCRFDIPPPPTGSVLDPNEVNVLFTPPGGTQELIPQSASASCDQGWEYSPDQSQVQLCGSTCDRVRSSNGAVTLQFGCATQVH